MGVMPRADDKKPLSVALIGYGPRGQEHASAIQAVPGFLLAGISDEQEDRRNKAAKQANVATSKNFRTLVREISPEVVVVATQPQGRAALCEEIFEVASGLKALLIEKPFAVSLRDAVYLRDQCQKRGISLIVGHQLRFCPEFVLLKKTIEEGEIGRAEFVRGTCFGNLLDQGTHILDLICWLFGKHRVQWVQSQAVHDSRIIERFATGVSPCWKNHSHPAPPWMVHHIAFDGGIRATIETGPLYQRSAVFIDDWLQKRVTVVGTKGVTEAQAAGFFRLLREGEPVRQISGSLQQYGNATTAMYAELYQTLVYGGVHRNRAEESLRSFELLAACAQSAANRSIVGMPPDPQCDPFSELNGSTPATQTVSFSTSKPASVVTCDAESRPLFSVIIALPDHRGHALDCLKGWLENQSIASPQYEIVVVGNSCHEPLAAEMSKLFRPHDRWLTVDAHEIEMFHRGAEVAHGHWLLFTEPHVVPEPFCLWELAVFLDRQDCSGGCLRSIPGSKKVLAQMENRLYESGFRTWSQPADWRKVILRGFFIRREIYFDVGGFEYQYGRFAEWALAARLHDAGHALGFASGAVVRHFDAESIRDLFPPVWDFAQGEMAFRAENDERWCNRYFGHIPDWSNRLRERKNQARARIRVALRYAWRQFRQGSCEGRRFGRLLASEAIRSLPTAIAGPKWGLFKAKCNFYLHLARVKWFHFGIEDRYRAYQKMYDGICRYARHDFLCRFTAEPEKAWTVSTTEILIHDLDDSHLQGFHAREFWDGKPFRWTGLMSSISLGLERGDYKIFLNCGGLLPSEYDRPVEILFNGNCLSQKNIRRLKDGIRFRLKPTHFRDGTTQTLTILSQPLQRQCLAVSENRQLGLPLFSIRFETVYQKTAHCTDSATNERKESGQAHAAA